MFKSLSPRAGAPGQPTGAVVGGADKTKDFKLSILLEEKEEDD